MQTIDNFNFFCYLLKKNEINMIYRYIFIIILNYKMQIIKTLHTLRLLKNNPKLLDMYTNPFNINRLYELSKKNYHDKHIQQIYNQLDEKYKYHSIVFYGYPYTLFIVKPSLIKKITKINL